MRALEAAGVDGARKLAAETGATPERVAFLIEKSAGKQSPSGFIVSQLRGATDPPEPWRRQYEDLRRTDAAVREVLAGMSPEVMAERLGRLRPAGDLASLLEAVRVGILPADMKLRAAIAADLEPGHTPGPLVPAGPAGPVQNTFTERLNAERAAQGKPPLRGSVFAGAAEYDAVAWDQKFKERAK